MQPPKGSPAAQCHLVQLRQGILDLPSLIAGWSERGISPTGEPNAPVPPRTGLPGSAALGLAGQARGCLGCSTGGVELNRVFKEN